MYTCLFNQCFFWVLVMTDVTAPPPGPAGAPPGPVAPPGTVAVPPGPMGLIPPSQPHQPPQPPELPSELDLIIYVIYGYLVIYKQLTG